jgi:hypothetical protein
MRSLWITLAWVVGLLAVSAAIAFFVVGGVGEQNVKPASIIAGRVCPPQVSMPPRGPGEPRDDLVGVRLGYTAADMESTVLCLSDDYKFRAESVWHTMVSAAKGEQRQLLYAERNGDGFIAGLVRVAGEDRALTLWRMIDYAAAKAPARAALEQEFITYFGPAHLSETLGPKRMLVWAYDPFGKPLKLAAKEGDLFGALGDMIAGEKTVQGCLKHVSMSALDKPAWGEGCGLTVRVEIASRPEEASKAETLRIAMVDQARLKSAVENFRKDVGR